MARTLTAVHDQHSLVMFAELMDAYEPRSSTRNFKLKWGFGLYRSVHGAQ